MCFLIACYFRWENHSHHAVFPTQLKNEKNHGNFLLALNRFYFTVLFACLFVHSVSPGMPIHHFHQSVLSLIPIYRSVFLNVELSEFDLLSYLSTMLTISVFL